MISINKYGQNIDFSNIEVENGKKSLSLDGLVLDKSLIIEVTKGTKFSTTLQEEDLKIEFKDVDGNIFELILKNMATLLAQNDGTQLVEIIQADDNKVLASITDITTALAAAAAGPAGPAAGANTNSDSAANTGLNNDENNLSNSTYDNASLTNDLNTATIATALSRANVAPIVTAISDQNVDEDNTLLINFSALDLNNDTLVSTATALNGTVTVNGNVITYIPNTNFNGNDTITLTVNDGITTTTQTIAVTVNPINDVPTISADATTVIEDAAALLTTGGTITVVDVDANESFVTPQTNVAGLYGTFNIAANGVWTYSADNTQSAIQELGATETLTETFAVTSLDGTATTNVVVTIQGTNDLPELSVVDAILIENTSSITFTFDASDIDGTISTAGESLYGTISIDGNQVTYTPSATFKGTDTITLTTTDNDGGVVSKTITITETLPSVSIDDVSASEPISSVGQTQNPSQLLIPTSSSTPFTLSSPTGYELPDTISAVGGIVVDILSTTGARLVMQLSASSLFEGFFSSSIGTIGTQQGITNELLDKMGNFSQISVRFTLEDGDTGIGNFDYNQNNLLLNGITVGNFSDITTVETSQSGTQFNNTTNQGFRNNDLDTGWFSITDQTKLQELFNKLYASQQLEIQLEDVDYGDNYFNFQGGIDTSYLDISTGPTLTVSSNMATFTISLDKAGYEDIVIQYEIIDGSAISGGTIIGEDDYVKTIGTVTIPAGQTTATIDVVINEDYIIEGNENFFVKILSVTNASLVDSEGEGTIVNSNHTPLIADSSEIIGTVVEEGNAVSGISIVSGNIIAEELDQGETISWSFTSSSVSPYGVFELDQNGKWTYTLNNTLVATQGLSATDIIVEEYTVKVEDSFGAFSEKVVSITITGTNDAPVLNTITAVTVSEDDSVFSGTITSSDVDANATAVYTTTSTVAGFILNANGTYTFDAADAAYQSLAEGEIQTITIPVTVTDDENATDTQNLTITVTGTNDKPVISAYTEVTNVQENVLTGSISLTDVALVDVDLTDTHTFVALTNAVTTVVDTNSVGIGAITVSMDVNGNYTLSGAGIEKLGAGESATVTFSVQVKDDSATATNTSTPATITLTIDGSNDAPTVSNVVVNGLIEETSFVDYAGKSDLVYTSTVALSASDVDTNDTYTFAKSSFTGTNGEAGLQVSLVQSDVLFMQAYNLASAGNATALTALKAAFAELISKDAISAIIASSTTLSTLTDDIEDASDFTALLAVLNNNSFLSLSATSTSVTVTAEATVAQTAILEASNAIKITVNANGTYTVASPFINSLAEGEVAKITFGYKAIDDSLAANNTSTPATVTLTVTGTNDKPVITSLTASNVTESDLRGSLVAVVTDEDVNDGYTFVVETVAATVDAGSAQNNAINIVSNVTVAIQSNGDYTVSGTGIENLAAGEITTITFDVRVSDGTTGANGGESDISATKSVSLTITGTNDAPIIAPVSNLVIESSLLDTPDAPSADSKYVGQLSATDADLTDTHTFYRSGTTLGLTITTSSSGLVNAFDTDQIEYVRNVVLKIVSIDEIKTLIDSTTDVDALAVINAVKDAPSIDALKIILSGVGITTTLDATAGTLTFNVLNAHILEELNLIEIDIMPTDGSYSITSSLFNHLGVSDNISLSFGYVAKDSSNEFSDPNTVTLKVTGTNDTPEVTNPVEINVIKDTTTIDVDINSDKALSNYIYDFDITDDHNFNRFGETLGLTITTSSSGLVNAFDTDQIEYVRNVVLKIVSIDEIKTLIDSTTDVDALAVINAVKNAPSIDALKIILSGVGITTTLDTTAGTLTFNVLNAHILEELNLIEINMLTDGDGSYSITSSLFNHLGVADTLSMSFGYSVTDSGAETVNDGIVTVNIQGTNDIPTINDVTISTNENALTNSTKLEIGIDSQFALSNYSFDPDVTDDFTYLRSETNTKLGLTITSQDAVLLAAVENNNNLAYVKTLVSELISIPEVAAVLSSITNTTILTLVSQLQMATSVTELVNMINAIPTVSLIKDASGLNLVLEDASILETTNLLKIVIDGSGSYTVESALFDRMSSTTSVSLNFDYEAQDSGYSGGITQEATITVNIAGSNDRPEVIKVIVSNIETNGTQNFTGQLTATDADVGSVFTFEMVSTGGNNKNITNDGRQFESIEINGVFAKIISTKSNLTDPDEIAEDRTMLKSIVINGLSISSTGVYSVAGNFDALGEQESVTLRFAYKANDNSGETNALSQSNLVEITIQGTNDAPVAMGSSIIVSNDSVSYVGQLLANDLDVNDKLTYSYDNTASASMTLSVTDWINLGAIVPLNGVDNLSALSALNTLLTNPLTKTDFLTFMSTYGLSISTLKTFLVDNSDNILALKDLISSNQTIITQITSLNATDIALIDTLTAANIATLQDLFTALSSNVPNPNANANAYNHFFSAINDFITSHPNVLDLLDDAPMIISKIQSISTVDKLTGEITVTANMPSSMIDIDADTGEYEVLNLSLSSLPDNTQVEVNFGYTVTDSIDTSSATASMLISADDVTSKVSIDTNGVMTIEDNYSIDMASLLSNASIIAAEVDSIDLSNSEHVLSNITISDFEQMVSDDGSNVLSITGDKDDVVKLDLSVWSKDNADTDLNSVVDSVDDNFIAYKATGTNDVLTLLIDKDIIVQDI